MVAKVAASPKNKTSNGQEEIIGQTLSGLFESQFADELVPILKAHGITSVDPNKWYPLQLVLDIYADIASRQNAMSRFVAIGVEVFDTIPIPDGVDTVLDGLHMLNEIHDMSVRNAEYVPYEITQVADNHIHLVERTPFPHDLIYGYIYGIAKRLKFKGTTPIVYRTYMNEADPNSDGAFYDIKW